jgi:mono/diheme cytochrome c family protein
MIGNPDALAEQGMKVYQEQYCGICHQLDAASTAGRFGPTHNGFAQTAEQRIRDPQYTGEAATAGEYIRESILSPELYLVKGYEHSSHHMPAYTNLSGTDLDAVVQLLLLQK